ncbi:MAG: ATP-dependent DNA helicase RecQ [Verrucomicrobiota bacterium]
MVFSPLLDIIRQRWAVDTFRPLQAEAIDAALAGLDSLVVMPTGSGKSLCYQAPADIVHGYHQQVTVVISPLISLMKDQVDALGRRRIPAAFLNSTQHHRDQVAIQKRGKDGELALLYMAPERAMTPGCLKFFSECRINAFIIDEAHCIAHWGHDFRADYARLGRLRSLFPHVPIRAFTATATPKVRGEIIEQLALRNPVVLVGDFDRPNLFLRVEQSRDREGAILDFIRARSDQPGIVYAITRLETERLADLLERSSIHAVAYHAGLDDAERDRVQNLFMAGRVDVIVATIAFGMGIDKPDVRWIVHAAMPSSIEQYHQEIGRAGRDGKPAECVLFFDDADFDTWCRVMCIDEDRALMNLQDDIQGPDEVRFLKLDEVRFLKLDVVMDYCVLFDNCCRHRTLTGYFAGGCAPDQGETPPAGFEPEPSCNACDVCAPAGRMKEEG